MQSARTSTACGSLEETRNAEHRVRVTSCRVLKTQRHRIGRGAGLPAEDKKRLESDSSQQKLGLAAYEAAMAATALCKTFRERLDMYQLAAEAGQAEARVR